MLETIKPPEDIKVMFYKVDYPMELLEKAGSRIEKHLLELKKRGIIVTFIDADEVRNRLVIGLEKLTEENKKAILELINDLLPPQAIIFKEHKPTTPEVISETIPETRTDH